MHLAEEPGPEDQAQQMDQMPFPFPNLPFPFLPPEFVIQLTGQQGQREIDVKSKLWDLTHLLVMCGIGLYIVMGELGESGAWSRFGSLSRSGEHVGYWVSLNLIWDEEI
jgi:hypothetical protein